MGKQRLFWLLWIAFISYALLAAPPNQPDEQQLIQNLLTGHWQAINPIIVALFNLLGIWPVIYACLMVIDGRGQKVAAWPFVAAAFGAGVFAILPYLALRQPQIKFSGHKHLGLKILDSRWIGVILSLASAGLVAYGLTGDWSDFFHQWQTSRLVHVMGLDFCLLSLVFPALVGDDMARRGLQSSQLFWLVTWLPLFGPLAYLCLRPPLPDNEQPLAHPQTQS